MSLLMSLLDDLSREMYNSSLYDHDFGSGLHPQHIQAPPPHAHPHHHHLQREPTIGQLLGLRNLTGQHHLPTAAARRAATNEKAKGEGQQLAVVGKDGYQVCMDVTQFKPNELNVKVLGNDVVVEGKHEEREDGHGYISRHFVRRYTLPKDYDPEKVMSSLSSDGILTVSIPKPQAIEDSSNERVIQIQQTGPAHLNIKPNEQYDTANGTADQ